MKKRKMGIAALAVVSLFTMASCSLQGPQGETGPAGPKGDTGEAGSQGIQGVPGKDGSAVYSGKGAPSGELGKSGDIYIDATSGDIYSKSTAAWIKTGNIKGATGDKGADGNSILGVAKTSSSGNVDTYTITYSDGSTSSFTVTNGQDGPTGAQGVPGKDGHTPTITIGSNGNWFVDGEDTGFSSVGEKGEKGDKGDKGDKGVSILSIELISTTDNIDTYTVRFSDGSFSTLTVTNGKDGATPSIGDNGNWFINGVDTGVPARGESGADGRGIDTIELKSSDDGKSVYTIHYTDGTTSDFVVTNGKDGITPTIGDNGNWWVGDVDTGVAAQGPKGDKGEDGVSILSIALSSTDGNMDTYTIAYSDGTTSTFTITNGKDGSQGIQGEPGKDGHTPTISIGSNGNWIIDGEDTGIAAKGPKGDKGDKGDQGVSVVNSYIDENGDLICELSNGQKINAGHVKDVTKHTVTFHVDDEIVSTIQVPEGSKISKPGKETTDGYTINYWYINDADGSKVTWKFVEDSYFAYTVDADIDLYADYKGNEYTVSFVDETYGMKLDAIAVTYDVDYSFTQLSGIVGYTNTDWKTKDGASYGFSGKYRIASDVTLYAEWKNNEYTVTLDPAKGSVSETAVSVTYDKPYSLPTPERLNYTFLGWYDDEGKLVSQNATWKRTKDETFTARWTNVQNTYVLDPGDGVCDTASMVIGWEDEYELPEAERSEDENYAYIFDGWYLGETKLPQKGTWTYANVGVTLMAKYKVHSAKLGKYPQTKITDASTLTSLSDFETNLPTSSNSNGWTSYKYYIGGSKATDFMWHKDVECGGNRYRAVYFTSYRPYRCSFWDSADDLYQDNNWI